MTAAPAHPADSRALLLHLYEHERGALAHYLARRIGERDPGELGEDLCQDAFVRAWQARPEAFDGGLCGARAWLYRVATNAAVDLYRRRRLVPMHPLDPAVHTQTLADPDPAGDPEARALAGAALAGAAAVLARRPRVGRALLLAQTGTYAAAGARLGMTVPAVKSAIGRLRLELRAARAAEGW